VPIRRAVVDRPTSGCAVTQELTESGGSAGHFDDLTLGGQVPERVHINIGLAAVSTGGTNREGLAILCGQNPLREAFR
jgi:hypothetical protein